jgi:superfamily II helicase
VKDTIRISELAEKEMAILLKDDKFNMLRPSLCHVCKNETSFRRRVFEVSGNNIDEQAAHLACSHVSSKYKCETVFLKKNKRKYYVDSAICEKCGSTKIVYDIELNDELFEAASKLTKVPHSEMKKDIERVLKVLKGPNIQ